MDPEPRRRIPRFWLVVVPALALTVSAVLVGLAWRANRASREAAPSTPPAPATDAFTGCVGTCHEDLDKVFKEGRRPNLLYRHEEHFALGVSDCSVCHPANTHEPDLINRPTMSRCFTCHGLTRAAIAPGDCEVCHPPGMAPVPETHMASRWAQGAHGKLAKTDRFECLTCHLERFCSSCHGLTLPHPENWAERPHAVAFFDEVQLCGECHPRAPEQPDDCDTCHHPRATQDVGWRATHWRVVSDEGARECFGCHDPNTCATCHVQGREDFSADRERFQTAAGVEE